MVDAKKDAASKTRKVFISYCWTSPEHEDWVHSLAERLVSNGVEVKYDKWDLKEGQDKYSFMESMVQDETINKVLIICDKGYKEKADKRKGGVGTETQIITSELYDKVNQTKFVPIIVEQGKSLDSYMPVFIKSRKYINMSNQTSYEDGYEQLLRNIYERPKYSKPKLGTMPSFLEEGGPATYKTKHINSSLQNCIYKNPEQCGFYMRDFIDEFKNTLLEFEIEYLEPDKLYDEIVYNKIHEMLSMRNDYVLFLDMLCKAKQLNIDLIIKLFEDLYPFTEFQGEGRFNECQFDQYRFLILELFLYTIVILLKNEEYENINILINSPYFVNRRFSSKDNCSAFNIFRFNINSFNIRNVRLNLNRVSVTADILIERSSINNISYKENLIDADIILYYLSRLKNNDFHLCWFPTTYIYKDEYSKVDLLRRLISKRHFEKIKVLFGVNNAAELKDLFNGFDEEANKQIRYSNSWNCVPSLKWQISPEDICTIN